MGQRQYKTVLFLGTGNYYRSRYAEILFNWEAQKRGLAWHADSRGLDPDPLNAGPMSRHTKEALRKLGIPIDKHLRFPITASAASEEAVAPRAPIAMPMSAAASAGASLTPSPTITVTPRAHSSRTARTF